MRRATALAFALLLAMAVPAQAGRVQAVTGTYQTAFGDVVATVTVDARAGDAASGWFSFTNTVGGYIYGPVTCVTIDGADAWLAGLVDRSDIPGAAGWAARVHDGGTPGTNGDLAITFLSYDSLVPYCEKAKTSSDRWLVPVRGGNVVIH